MAIESKLAKGYWGRKLVLSILFIVFGCWSLYDVLVKYPAQNEAADQWETRAELQQKQASGRLSSDEQEQLSALNARFANTMSPPTPVASLDMTINRIVAACAFPAAGLFLLTWWLASRKSYAYRDDGTLVTPEGTFAANEITGIDLTRWKSKSLARVEVGPDKGVTLDAWIYDGVEDMIRALDARFHPEPTGHDAAVAASDAEKKTSEPETGSDSDGDVRSADASADDDDDSSPTTTASS